MAAALLALLPLGALADDPSTAATPATATPAASVSSSASSTAAQHAAPSAASSRSLSPARSDSAVPGPKSAPARQLDLAAPPIEHVMTPEAVQSLIADREADEQDAEDVMVESPHYESPVPTGTFRALPWALMHPLEAWRIVTPITD